MHRNTYVIKTYNEDCNYCVLFSKRNIVGIYLKKLIINELRMPAKLQIS